MAGTTRPEVEVFDSVEAIADRFTGIARDAGSIGLSRPTPTEVFVRVRLPRSAEVFQVDERCAPAASDERNATLIERSLGPRRFRPMPVDGDLASAAAVYERLLVERCGSPPVLDLVHLGLGADGHTASLLPGDPVLDVSDRWVASTQEASGFERLTMTYETLDSARSIVFVVVGEQKAEAMERVMRGDRTAPAARLRARNILFLLDEAAASRVSS